MIDLIYLEQLGKVAVLWVLVIALCILLVMATLGLYKVFKD